MAAGIRMTGLRLYGLCIQTALLACLAAAQASPRTLSYHWDDEIPGRTEIGRIVQDTHLDQEYERSILDLFRFDVINGEHKRYFEVDPISGAIRTSRFLDRDEVCRGMSDPCEIHVELGVVSPGTYFQVIQVTLTLKDKNDNAPTFTQQEATIHISENAFPEVTFVLPNAEDPDSGLFGIQEYSFRGRHPSAFGLMVLENMDGSMDLSLVLHERLNREQQSSYSLQIEAKDGGKLPKTGVLDLQIIVVDSNDNSPTFTSNLYNISVRENEQPSTILVRVHANDLDAGLNAQVVYSFSRHTADTYGDLFGIRNDTGEIYLRRELDYEQETTYALLVTAQDMGPDSVPAQAKVMVNVEDVNDFVPQLTINSWSDTGAVEVAENTPAGEFIAHISVVDRDGGPSGHVTCHVQAPEFRLESMFDVNNYKLVTNAVFDREVKADYVLEISCQDRGRPPLGVTHEIPVRVADQNDHAPVFSQSHYSTTLVESADPGTSLVQVQATDQDAAENADVTYHLHANSQNLLRVDPDTGEIRTAASFDREKMAEFEFYVLAMDQGIPRQSSTATVRISVQDVNDEAPRFVQKSYNFGTFENQPSGTEIGALVAVDADSQPFDNFVYSLQNNSTFLIHPTSGAITSRRVLDREMQEAHFLVAMATNTEPPFLSASVSVTIYVADRNDNAPRILYPSERDGVLEVSTYVPAGSIFTRINATDADLGNNAKLLYSIAKGNEDGVFGIDPLNGALSLNLPSRPPSEADPDEYKLLLMVQDQGTPPKSAVTTLRVLVNRTQAYARWLELPQPKDAGGVSGLLGYHQKILIVLSAVTLIIVLILVTAIVLIKRRQAHHSRESFKYVSRPLNGQAKGAPPVATPVPVLTPATHTLDNGKKAVQFDIQGAPYVMRDVTGTSISDVRSHCEGQNDLNHPRTPSPGSGSKKTSCPVHGHSTLVRHLPNGRPTNVPLEPPPYKVCIRPEDPRDSDSTSGCSADMSNSDSGRGPSDEGDHHSNGRRHHRSMGAELEISPPGSATNSLRRPGREGHDVDPRDAGGFKGRAPQLPPRTSSLGKEKHMASQPGCHGYQNNGSVGRSGKYGNNGKSIGGQYNPYYQSEQGQRNNAKNNLSQGQRYTKAPGHSGDEDLRSYTQRAPLQMKSFAQESPYYRHDGAVAKDSAAVIGDTSQPINV